MKTKGLLFCLALCLVFVRIYSINVLETMEDLKKIKGFGKHFPRHGLLLLCWLLTQGKIDQNGKLRLNFDVSVNFPYGIHPFHNKEGIFPNVSNTNFKYYTLGSLFYKNAQKQLPEYITRDVKSSDHPKKNTDRIVMRVHEHNPSVVDEVYITEHYGGFTHMIGEQLLREIEALCHNNRNDTDRTHDKEDPDDQRFQQIKSRYPNEVHVHQFLYKADYVADDQAKSSHNKKSQNINLELKSTWDRQARIVWTGIPDEMLKMEMKIGVYIDEDEDEPLVEYSLDGREHGEIDTPLALTPGLHVRLVKQLTISEPVFETVPWKPVVASHTYFRFSQLFSLVYSAVSNVCSLLYFVVSNVCSLVYSAVSNVCSLVYFVVSNVCSLVYFVVSNVCSLVYITVSNVCSLVYSVVSNVCSLVYSAISNVCSLVYFVVSKVCSLVYNAVSNLFSVVNRDISNLSSVVYFAVNSLFSLVYFTVSSLFSLVYFAVSSFLLALFICAKSIADLVMFILQLISLILELVLLLLIGILVLRMNKTRTNRNDDRSRVPPQFIIVSHGRPGF